MGCGRKFCSTDSQNTVCTHTVAVDARPIQCAIYRQPKLGGRAAVACIHTGTRRGTTMLDKELRSMIGDVKDGRMDRRAFIRRLAAVGLTAPMANQMLAIGGVAMAQSPSPYQADQARRRRSAQAAVVAGADPAQSAFRHRHQGSGRLARLLRAARQLGRRRQSRSDPRRRNSIDCRMAASPPTASRSPGRSSPASNGTTASR